MSILTYRRSPTTLFAVSGCHRIRGQQPPVWVPVAVEQQEEVVTWSRWGGQRVAILQPVVAPPLGTLLPHRLWTPGWQAILFGAVGPGWTIWSGQSLVVLWPSSERQWTVRWWDAQGRDLGELVLTDVLRVQTVGGRAQVVSGSATLGYTLSSLEDREPATLRVVHQSTELIRDTLWDRGRLWYLIGSELWADGLRVEGGLPPSAILVQVAGLEPQAPPALGWVRGGVRVVTVAGVEIYRTDLRDQYQRGYWLARLDDDWEITRLAADGTWWTVRTGPLEEAPELHDDQSPAGEGRLTVRGRPLPGVRWVATGSDGEPYQVRHRLAGWPLEIAYRQVFSRVHLPAQAEPLSLFLRIEVAGTLLQGSGSLTYLSQRGEYRYRLVDGQLSPGSP